MLRLAMYVYLAFSISVLRMINALFSPVHAMQSMYILSPSLVSLTIGSHRLRHHQPINPVHFDAEPLLFVVQGRRAGDVPDAQGQTPDSPSQFRIMTLSPSTSVLVPFRGPLLRAAPSPAHCLLSSPNALKRIGPSIRSLVLSFFKPFQSTRLSANFYTSSSAGKEIVNR